MRDIVISMQNTLLSETVARALSEAGEFRVEQVLPGKTGDAFSLCQAAQADILLMEVSRLNAYALENRMNLIERVRAAVPNCTNSFCFATKTATRNLRGRSNAPGRTG